MTTYTTKKGEMWDQIALEQLGNGKYANQLIDMNFQHSNVVKFDAGVVLVLPVIVASRSAVNLPPWK